MILPPLNVKEIFDHAVEIGSPVEREAYLNEACADMLAVRRRSKSSPSVHCHQ